MKYWTNWLLGILIVVLIGMGILCVVLAARDRQRMADLETWMRRFCLSTQDGIRADRRALEGDDEREREFAARRFNTSDVIHHNSQSIEMCTNGWFPPSNACGINRDWPCLAKMAREAERHLSNNKE